MSARSRLKVWLTRLPIVSVARRALDETWADSRTRSACDVSARSHVVAFGALIIDVARVFAASAMAALIFEEPPLQNIASDARHGLRRLRRSPIFTAFAILTLALGIGATTAIYSAVHALFRPQDIRRIDEVVNIYQRRPPANQVSMSDLNYISRHQTVFSEIAPWTRIRPSLSGAHAAALTMGEAVGGAYFSLVGVTPELGRTLQPADNRPDAPAVVVISDSTWRISFGGDPNIVGVTIKLNGHPFEVVGVIPPSFRGVDVPNIAPTPLWVPLTAASALEPLGLGRDGTLGSVWIKARLTSGETPEHAALQIARLAKELDAVDSPAPSSESFVSPWDKSRDLYLRHAADVRVHETVDAIGRPLANVLLAAVVLVLLVACTNLANLMLARGTDRRHELAVRLALGASRARIVRELLVESALIAVFGGAAGLVVAEIVIGILKQSIHVGPGVTMVLDARLEPAVMTVAAGATMLALLVFGLLPALQSTRADVRAALTVDTSNAALPRWRGRRLLIVAQVVVSTMLVGLAALCVRQITMAAHHDTGVDLDRLAIVRLDESSHAVDEARIRHDFAIALAAARQQHGVETAALVSGLPFGDMGPGVQLRRPDQPAAAPGQTTGRQAELLSSTPDVFRTMGVSILRGRGFTAGDDATAPHVVVVSELTARQVFETADVIGRQIVLHRYLRLGETDRGDELATIVGVASDTDTVVAGLERRSGSVYVPIEQQFEPRIDVIARVESDPETLVTQLRTAVERVAPDLTIADVGTGPSITFSDNLPLRIAGGLAGSLGTLALALALAGLYGVLSHLVAKRTREIGVRMALGADARQIRRRVMIDGLSPVLIGTTVGMALGAIARLAMKPFFVFVFPAIDPLVVVGVPVLFTLAALLASYWPARRAARVDPNVALREL